MRLETTAILAVLLLATLAGCVAPAREDAASAGPPGGWTLTTEPYPRKAHWTDCQGFFSMFPWPLGAPHAPHAPGWEPMDLSAATEIELYGLECQRFSMGPFERGPVRMVMETHGYQEAPESCYPEVISGAIELQTLNSIWFDDPEIVEYIDTVLEMPVYYSNITVEAEIVEAETRWWQWSWGIEGQETSWLRAFDDRETSAVDQFQFRIFWYNDTAVSAMDYVSHENGPGWVQNIVAYGEMHSPMLMSEWPTDFYGGANTLLEARADAEITRYNDHVCTETIE